MVLLIIIWHAYESLKTRPKHVEESKQIYFLGEDKEEAMTMYNLMEERDVFKFLSGKLCIFKNYLTLSKGNYNK